MPAIYLSPAVLYACPILPEMENAVRVLPSPPQLWPSEAVPRSEERRVGKECIPRVAAEQEEEGDGVGVFAAFGVVVFVCVGVRAIVLVGVRLRKCVAGAR